jgi:hypothetical protein
MRDSGIPEKDIEIIVWHNPKAFFNQSGKLSVDALERSSDVDQSRLWEGNSVLRGQTPAGEGKIQIKM